MSWLYLTQHLFLWSDCDQQRSVSLEIESNDPVNTHRSAILLLSRTGGPFSLASAYIPVKPICSPRISTPTGPLTIPPRIEPLDLVLWSSKCLIPLFLASFHGSELQISLVRRPLGQPPPRPFLHGSERFQAAGHLSILVKHDYLQFLY